MKETELCKLLGVVSLREALKNPKLHALIEEAVPFATNVYMRDDYIIVGNGVSYTYLSASVVISYLRGECELSPCQGVMDSKPVTPMQGCAALNCEFVKVKFHGPTTYKGSRVSITFPDKEVRHGFRLYRELGGNQLDSLVLSILNESGLFVMNTVTVKQDEWLYVIHPNCNEAYYNLY